MYGACYVWQCSKEKAYVRDMLYMTALKGKKNMYGKQPWKDKNHVRDMLRQPSKGNDNAAPASHWTLPVSYAPAYTLPRQEPHWWQRVTATVVVTTTETRCDLWQQAAPRSARHRHNVSMIRPFIKNGIFNENLLKRFNHTLFVRSEKKIRGPLQAPAPHTTP